MNDFRYVAPPTDGLREALLAARGRRYRTAGLSSTATATALIVAVAVLGGQGTQSLVQQPTPEQPAVTRIVPGPAAKDAGTSNTVSTVTSNNASYSAPAPGRRATGQITADPAEVAPPAAGDVRGTDSDKPYSAGRITRSDGMVYLPRDPRCNVTGKTEDATTLCPSSSVYASNTGIYTLNGDVCSTRTDTTALHFATANEVDFTIRRGTAEVWRWSRWHPATERAHTVEVETGSCSQWTFDWTGVDASGNKLPKGDYTLRTTFLASELTGRSTVTYAFTIS